MKRSIFSYSPIFGLVSMAGFLNNPNRESNFYLSKINEDQHHGVGNSVALSSEAMAELEKLFLELGVVPSDEYLDYMTIARISGGITNALYVVSLYGPTLFKVVLRLFGTGTEQFIDRKIENIVFAYLSSIGYGPVFHGLFSNGRLEGYLNDMKSLSPEEMWLRPIYLQVAKNAAFLHSLEIEEVRSVQGRWMWEKIALFFELASNPHFGEDDTTKMEKYRRINLSIAREEFCRLEASISAFVECIYGCTTKTLRSMGRSIALETCLCHNDLLSGNIMKSDGEVDEHVSVKLIDYEYAGYNYRGYDVANHFCEFGGFEFDPRNRFPSRELRHDFIRSYLSAALATTDCPYLAEEQEVIEGFDDVVQVMTLASHLFWGTWAVVQGTVSAVDFDYLGYAQLRYEAISYHKEVFNIDFARLMSD